MTVLDYDDGSRVIQNVPAYHQGETKTCGQACITSILNYWGHNVSYQQVINDTNPSGNAPGMSPEQIIWYFRRYNLQAKSYRGNIFNLKSSVDKGLPVIVGFDDMDIQHVVVVVGYNDYREVIYYIDSMDGEMIEEPYSDFVRAWNRQRLNTTGYGLESMNNLVIQVTR